MLISLLFSFCGRNLSNFLRWFFGKFKTSKSHFEINCPLKLNSGAVNSVKFLTSCDNIIVAGTDEGTVNIISLPDMKILQQIHDSDSSVQCLLPLKNGFLCGKYDGACVWYGFDSSSDLNEVLYEITIILSGADVDPITDISRDYDYIYTSCRDGCIRKYSINNMFSGTS